MRSAVFSLQPPQQIQFSFHHFEVFQVSQTHGYSRQTLDLLLLTTQRKSQNSLGPRWLKGISVREPPVASPGFKNAHFILLCEYRKYKALKIAKYKKSVYSINFKSFPWAVAGIFVQRCSGVHQRYSAKICQGPFCASPLFSYTFIFLEHQKQPFP